jgi:hypothetical protein
MGIIWVPPKMEHSNWLTVDKAQPSNGNTKLSTSHRRSMKPNYFEKTILYFVFHTNVLLTLELYIGTMEHF